MRRFAIAVVVAAIVLVALAAAGFASGRMATYELYTHCGIRYVDFGGKRLYADPVLGDRIGNPPWGWGNPTDSGVIVARDSDTVYFIDWTGHHATFTTHPRGGVPTIPLCS